MIYTYTDETQLSAHFNVREFRCKCGRSHDIELNPDLILKLEKLYRALDCTKIIITSGYRCSDHDKAVGGNGYGQHTKGNAADIICYDQDGEIINTKKSPAEHKASVSEVLATLTVHTLQFTLTCVQAQSGTATKLYAEVLPAA